MEGITAGVGYGVVLWLAIAVAAIGTEFGNIITVEVMWYIVIRK